MTAQQPLDVRLWLALGAECDNAPAPNAAEDDYAAGYIAGLAKAQQIMRRMLKASGVATEYGVGRSAEMIGPHYRFPQADEALAQARGIESAVFVRETTSWAPAFHQPAEKGPTHV
jgi:hypothetical protein